MEVIAHLISHRTLASPKKHASARLIQARARGMLARNRVTTCPICFKFSQAFAFPAGCGHKTCEKCANRWLEKSRSCPLCRAKAPMPVIELRPVNFLTADVIPMVRLAHSDEAPVTSRTFARYNRWSHEEFMDRVENHPEEFALLRYRFQAANRLMAHEFRQAAPETGDTQQAATTRPTPTAPATTPTRRTTGTPVVPDYRNREPGQTPTAPPPQPRPIPSTISSAWTAPTRPPPRALPSPAPRRNSAPPTPTSPPASPNSPSRPSRRSSLAKVGKQVGKNVLLAPRRLSSPVVSAFCTVGYALVEAYDSIVGNDLPPIPSMPSRRR